MMVENELISILGSNTEPDLDKIHDGDLIDVSNLDNSTFSLLSHKYNGLEKITQ